MTQATLSVLVRHYKFELRDGPDTNIEMVRTLLARPKVVGEDGFGIPMLVRRAD